MIFSELHDSQPFYRLRHWLRDGGAKYIFDSFFWAAMMALVFGFLSVALVLLAVRSIVSHPAPAKHTAPVIDHRRDGTAQSSRDTHLRFNITPDTKR